MSTHPDVNCPVDRGYMVDSGSLCALVTASTGKVPRYFGKPHMETLQMIMERTGCQKEEMVVIGDRLETDIALWALMDLDRLTMVEPPEDMIRAFAPEGKALFSMRRPGKIDGGQLAPSFRIQRRDLDTNGHVNNIRCMEIALPYRPSGRPLQELLAEYKHSAVGGDQVSPRLTETGEDVHVALCREDGEPFVRIQMAGYMG